MPRQAATDDDIPTLIALGVVAYACETMLHEAVGHGGICLATGGTIKLIEPLRMQCSVVTLAMIFAGPAANLISAFAFWVSLRLPGAKSDALRHFLWLSFGFNALVAAGYLVVGGATGFGDWPQILGFVRPAWVWHTGAVLVGATLYYFFLRVAAVEYVRLAGAAAVTSRRIFRMAVVPAIGAAFVAVAAEVAGERTQPLELLLALACTLGVGLSLTSIDLIVAKAEPGSKPAACVGFSVGWVIAGLVASLLYVFVIGPGIR
jgi:hypothetical protein